MRMQAGQCGENPTSQPLFWQHDQSKNVPCTSGLVTVGLSVRFTSRLVGPSSQEPKQPKPRPRSCGERDHLLDPHQVCCSPQACGLPFAALTVSARRRFRGTRRTGGLRRFFLHSRQRCDDWPQDLYKFCTPMPGLA